MIELSSLVVLAIPAVSVVGLIVLAVRRPYSDVCDMINAYCRGKERRNARITLRQVIEVR